MADLYEVSVKLEHIFENPFVKIFLKGFTKKKRLDRALEIFLDGEKPSNLLEWIDAKIVGFALLQGAKVFGGTKEDLIRLFSDPYYRRGLVTVIRSIAEYGVTRPQKLVAPFLVVWNITKRCNLRCQHCYANASPQGAPDELTTEQRLEVIDQLDEAGVVSIAFSGGEPLLTPDIYKILKHTSDTGMQVSIATNGTLLTPTVARKLKEVGVDYVEISIDSPDPKEHDKFRGVPGAWERAIQGIKNAKEAGLSTGMAFTVTKLNVHQVPDIIKLAKKVGVDMLVFFNFVPVGRGESIRQLDLTAEEREEFLRYIYDAQEKEGITIMSTAPAFARVSVQKVLEKEGKHISIAHFGEIPAVTKDVRDLVNLAQFIGGCGAGRAYCGLEHNGDIIPCVFMPIVVGNVLRDGFEKVWRENELLKALRERDAPNFFCKDCPYRYVCGGCRARAYAYTGDPLGPDPGCIIAEKLMKAKAASRSTTGS